MTVEEKKALNRARIDAVRKAWANEKKLVAQGKCTRQWTKAEVSELNAKGHISGYAGHHMKSVSTHPQYAGDPNNIQFLTRKEHIEQAHRGNTRTPTNGYYNPQTRTTEQFNGPPHKPVYSLNCSSYAGRNASQANSNAASARRTTGNTSSLHGNTTRPGRGTSNGTSTSTTKAASQGGTGSCSAKRTAGASNTHSG